MGRRRGFTLIELLTVMVIIGILMGFVTVVAMDGIRRGEERATQALIEKLDTALNDRLDALLSEPVNPTQAHNDMAAIWTSPTTTVPPPRDPFADPHPVNNPIPATARSQVIARYDFLKAELPDVFRVRTTTPGNATPGDRYPIDFGSLVAVGASATPNDLNFALPIDYAGTRTEVTGMYGASFTAAGALYKLLGYGPKGYNGVDDTPAAASTGIIDEYTEGIDGLTPGQIATINSRLAAHRHKTARAEMLYALLVEGRGPLGSAFSPDDFTDREVRDTDGDGLPEFVDAWGEPLRFYRWPIYHADDTSKGTGRYNVFDARDQDPLDPNQTLTAPGWFSAAENPSFPPSWTPTQPNATPVTGAPPLSGSARRFAAYFRPLWDPSWSAGAAIGTLWDRGNPAAPAADNFTFRRAYNARFLIVSSGPDRSLGVAELTVAPTAITSFDLMYEGTAAPDRALFPAAAASRFAQPPTGAAQDDITNRNLQSPGGLIQ
jgi:prepilin-type N-terminal cleavage/methylation domain-containing protein